MCCGNDEEIFIDFYKSEHGIRRGNEDFLVNQNKKSRKNFLFPREKKFEYHTFKKLIVGADDFGALTRRRKAL